ncbi:Spy/CpxP family protein refolding chaperone [bacterium]|nr:Spy/CpxP family protein refolding chaperone [bacterium]
MRRRTMWAIGVFALIMALTAGVSYAQGRFGRHHPGAGLHKDGFMFGAIERFADEIGLSDDQLDRISSIRTEMQKKIIDLRAKKQKAEIDLRDLMRDPKAKSSEIEKVAQKVIDLESQIKLNRIETGLKIRDVLTPEQREKVLEVIREHRQKMREHRRGEGFGEGFGSGSHPGFGPGMKGRK